MISRRIIEKNKKNKVIRIRYKFNFWKATAGPCKNAQDFFVDIE